MGKYFGMTAKDVDALDVSIGFKQAQNLGMCRKCSCKWKEAGFSTRARMPLSNKLLNTFYADDLEYFVDEMELRLFQKGFDTSKLYNDIMKVMTKTIARRWVKACIWKWSKVRNRKDRR